MAKDCKHEWEVRPSGKKEHCIHCRVARKVGSGPCKVDGGDHDYQLGKSGKKEYCIKCNAARVTLTVADSTIGTASTTGRVG